MNRELFSFRRRHWAWLLLGQCWVGGLLHAGATQLADVPLANASTVTVLPNIYFILDDSGSMEWDYMPDYVDSNYCRDNYTEDGNTDASLDVCRFGDPPFMASAFNRVYYNPLVNYAAPLNSDGSAKTSYTSWTSVPLDGYGIQFTSTGSYPRNDYVYDYDTVTPHDWAYGLGYNLNLTTQFPERKWCTSGSNSTTCSNNTVAALNASNLYVYPDSTYKYLRTVYGAPYYYNVTVEWCSQRNTSGTDRNFGKSGTCQAKKTSTYKYPRFSNWSKVTITPSVNSYPGPNGTTRTYSQEMTNFANWFAWYRSRMQMAKSGIGQAFANIRGTPNSSDVSDKNYFHARVGFSTISSTGTTDGSKFLKVDNFDTAQKSTWFTRLYGTVPSSGTPLLGALAKAGRMYAGKLSVDPVQYSCQRNFTILSSDGYWNSVTDAYGPTKEDGATKVGDLDSAASVARPSYERNATANTLADVAYYYYHTDLRPGSCSVCTDNVVPAGTKKDEDDIAQHQHMTTFTIGLGVDGTLTYQDGYKTSTTGDYQGLKQGTTDWPAVDPGTDDERKIDDLWHAAVNGRGTYFSARDPESLINGLTSALGTMESVTGSGAAAATSSLEPVEGDNAIYIANYTTVAWTGELSAYTVDLGTGAISSTSTWKASTQLDAKVSSDSDTRTIYMVKSGALAAFSYANLSTDQRAWFNNNQLSQYSDLSAGDQALATAENLVKYLRGQNRYEDQDRPSGFVYSRLYRDRVATLGDIIHAQPVYVKAPQYDFTDTGYAAFKTAQSARTAMVYVAANDGMLHAFDATTGNESWAFIPPQVMPNLWRLADKDYATNHRYSVDGPLTVTDIQVGGVWKTILIAGLGKGGRGYFALDITNPAAPAYLWSLSADDLPNLGYSYAPAVVTKINGVWSVLLPSGYNNIPEGSKYPGATGEGYLFVLNAATGAVIKTIGTGVGTVGNPSGLGRLNARVIGDFNLDNTAETAYAGDLEGNLWRFNLLAGTASKLIALGNTQPITAAPELGEISGKPLLFFGTGRYLGEGDLTLNQTQSLYGLYDSGATLSKGALVQQIISGSSISNNPVDWAANGGWYVNLPDNKERVHLDAKLIMGTLVFASTVPEASECQPGGYSHLFFLDYRTGGSVGTSAAMLKYVSPIVGVSAFKLPSGTIKVVPITADGKIPAGTPPSLPVSPTGSGGVGSGKRVMWRELLD
ncbi:PilC/PilY family type IV pilus protein [Dechloromonas sp. ZY10]|uniref:pilus assembly protein n=1 Tax=Dechloromonas aquae TaxID=2664436 RepID=UPI003528AADE